MRDFLYNGLPQLDSLQFSLVEGPRAKGHGLGHIFTGLSSVLPHLEDMFRGRALHLSLPFNSSYGASREQFLNMLHEALLARAQPATEREYEGVSVAINAPGCSCLLIDGLSSVSTVITRRSGARRLSLVGDASLLG